jgi:hypothetical protein
MAGNGVRIGGLGVAIFVCDMSAQLQDQGWEVVCTCRRRSSVRVRIPISTASDSQKKGEKEGLHVISLVLQPRGLLVVDSRASGILLLSSTVSSSSGLMGFVSEMES